MRKILSFLIFSFLIYNYGCRQTTNSDLKRPDTLQDDIKTSTLENVGMNTAAIKEIIEEIDSGFYPNRHSLLIFKNDKLLTTRQFTCGVTELNYTVDRQ